MTAVNRRIEYTLWRASPNWYREARIALEDGKPVLRLSKTPGMVGDLEHWQYDTFIARWRDRSLHRSEAED